MPLSRWIKEYVYKCTENPRHVYLSVKVGNAENPKEIISEFKEKVEEIEECPVCGSEMDSGSG